MGYSFVITTARIDVPIVYVLELELYYHFYDYMYFVILLKLPPTPTKAYTTLVPKFEKHPLFADFGQKKNTPFSTEIADFEAQ